MTSPVALACLLATMATGAVCQPQCPQWSEWQPWTDCLWMGFEEGRDTVFALLGFDIPRERLPTLPADLKPLPERCGHCVWRIRVRKRKYTADCRPIEVQSSPCGDHPKVCDMFLTNNIFNEFVSGMVKCSTVSLSPLYLRQCSNQAHMGEWVRDLVNQMIDVVPAINCMEYGGGECRCCCGETKPAADGRSCVPVPMAGEICREWGEFSDWSDQCMWFNTPPGGMLAGIEQQCSIDVAQFDDPLFADLLRVPAGVATPERCGYCSFRAKCRRRPAESVGGERAACFPLDVEKRACGADDCPGCDRPCHLPKVAGGCDYVGMMLNVAPGYMRRIDAMPADVKRGLVKLLANLPFGQCVEAGGQCRCCCHPYEPSADGGSCVLADACNIPLTDLSPQAALGLPRDEL